MLNSVKHNDADVLDLDSTQLTKNLTATFFDKMGHTIILDAAMRYLIETKNFDGQLFSWLLAFSYILLGFFKIIFCS